jgi:hypothetical protein
MGQRKVRPLELLIIFTSKPSSIIIAEIFEDAMNFYLA